ncbi:alkene reductase [Paraburkholderia dioscoreae]|uniref:N-ethylmaleimide reductase n=1 Tax=Paraburkholderia dioscoreae TaxID=2604047 RepID=A0A5Q4ZDZ4_9BURK|nr:alkene reductase [Paraburkholderia dioscoreae]VVD29013.1 N-ethylmaleimide reductase [Paraburkholderia dioscoreae]
MQPSDLFSPGALGGIHIPNRVAMAPLTRARADLDGVQTSLAAEYYSQRASAGLIVAEATNVSRQGRGYAYTPGIYTEAQARAWRQVTDAVHDAAGTIVLQLLHTGRISHVTLHEGARAPVGPSAIQAGGTVLTAAGMLPPSMPRALQTDEIPGVIDEYRHAARMAEQAGFDGVEIHMGNCFLLEQFLRDGTNRRDDQYGGSVENRLRLPVEVAEAVAEIWGAGHVGVRLSPVKTTIGETPLDSDPQSTYERLAERLGALGLAYLHCIEERAPAGTAGAFDFQSLRRAFDGAYIANGGYDRALAAAAIATGHADMVAFGKAFIGNPDLVDRLRLDRPLTEASAKTYYGGGAKGYTDYSRYQAG